MCFLKVGCAYEHSVPPFHTAPGFRSEETSSAVSNEQQSIAAVSALEEIIPLTCLAQSSQQHLDRKKRHSQKITWRCACVVIFLSSLNTTFGSKYYKMAANFSYSARVTNSIPSLDCILMWSFGLCSKAIQIRVCNTACMNTVHWMALLYSSRRMSQQKNVCKNLECPKAFHD